MLKNRFTLRFTCNSKNKYPKFDCVILLLPKYVIVLLSGTTCNICLGTTDITCGHSILIKIEHSVMGKSLRTFSRGAVISHITYLMCYYLPWGGTHTCIMPMHIHMHIYSRAHS